MRSLYNKNEGVELEDPPKGIFKKKWDFHVIFVTDRLFTKNNNQLSATISPHQTSVLFNQESPAVDNNSQRYKPETTIDHTIKVRSQKSSVLTILTIHCTLC